MFKWRRRQVESEVSVQGLTVELKKVNAQLVQVTLENLEPSTKLGAAAAELVGMVEELADMYYACDILERLVRCIVSQSFTALDALVNQAGAPLVDFILKNAYY